jgi:hypothetical protein
MNSTVQKYVDNNVERCITYLMYRLYLNYCKNPLQEDFPWFSDLYLRSVEDQLPLPSALFDYCPYDEDTNLREPQGFYIVSDSFAKQLICENALLTKHFGFWIWGRESTAMPLVEDELVQKIALRNIKYVNPEPL